MPRSGDYPAIMNAMMFLQRHELRRLGFYFATEETYTPEGVLQLPAWSQPLVVHPVDASSTDAHDQGPQNLLRDDNQFWSSTGSDSQDSNEWLQLRCEGLCCVQAVQIQGFRANFQPGWAEQSDVHFRCFHACCTSKGMQSLPMRAQARAGNLANAQARCAMEGGVRQAVLILLL